jgi:hypothetical protein
MPTADGSTVLVQPYCECNSTDCVLKTSDGGIELCSLKIPLTFQQWLDLLKKHDGLDGSVYVLSSNCNRGPDPNDELLEQAETYRVYRVANAKDRVTISAG